MTRMFIVTLTALLIGASLGPGAAQAQADEPPETPGAAGDAGAVAPGAAPEAAIDPQEAKRREKEERRLARENQKKASDLTKQGKKALAKKQLDAGIAALSEAYQLDPQPERLRNLGIAYQLKSQELEAAGAYDESSAAARQAYDLYQQFLATGPRGAIRREIEGYATALKAALDKDDKRRTRERELAEANKLAEQARVAAEGSAQAALAAKRKAEEELAAQRSENEALAAERDRLRKRSGRGGIGGSGAGAGKRTLGTALLVAGGASLGVSLAYGLAARQAESDLEGADPWPDSGDAYHSFGESAGSRGILFAVTGAALVTGGVVLYYLGGRDGRHSSERSGVAVSPALGVGGAGVQVAGYF